MSATARGGTPLTVHEWITRHIDHLTGVEQATNRRYRALLAIDSGQTCPDHRCRGLGIAPVLMPVGTGGGFERSVARVVLDDCLRDVVADHPRSARVPQIVDPHPFCLGPLAVRQAPEHDC